MPIRMKILLAFVLIFLVVCLRQGSSAQPPGVTLPLGLMGPSGDTPSYLGSESAKLSDTAAAGFNIVYEFRSVQEIREAEEYLDRAKSVGLQVVQNMPLCRAYKSNDPACQEYPVDVWKRTEWATFISTLAAYDNLVAWYLPDEIDDYEAAANLYRWVHAYDPQDRPVFANPGSLEQSEIDQFRAFADFLWAAGYPDLRGEPQALVTHMARLDANACRGTDKRWGTIVQFFDNEQFPQYGTAGHPTPRQLRSSSYQGIIGGGTGLWFFNYEMGRGDGLDGLWQEMITIADEIIGSGGLDEVILAPDVPQGIRRRIISGPTTSPLVRGQRYDSVQFLQKWQAGEGTYLFAVNVATDTVVAEFSNLWAESETVEVLFEGRMIPITDDSFRDTFAQDDVHIYFYTATRPAPGAHKAYVPVAFSSSD
jgi:hypothetical protein